MSRLTQSVAPNVLFSSSPALASSLLTSGMGTTIDAGPRHTWTRSHSMAPNDRRRDDRDRALVVNRTLVVAAGGIA
jgi:hypothetical protein